MGVSYYPYTTVKWTCERCSTSFTSGKASKMPRCPQCGFDPYGLGDVPVGKTETDKVVVIKQLRARVEKLEQLGDMYNKMLAERDTLKEWVKELEGWVRRAAKEADPDCPDFDAFVDGHCGLPESVAGLRTKLEAAEKEVERVRGNRNTWSILASERRDACLKAEADLARVTKEVTELQADREGWQRAQMAAGHQEYRWKTKAATYEKLLRGWVAWYDGPFGAACSDFVNDGLVTHGNAPPILKTRAALPKEG